MKEQFLAVFFTSPILKGEFSLVKISRHLMLPNNLQFYCFGSVFLAALHYFVFLSPTDLDTVQEKRPFCAAL